MHDAFNSNVKGVSEKRSSCSRNFLFWSSTVSGLQYISSNISYLFEILHETNFKKLIKQTKFVFRQEKVGKLEGQWSAYLLPEGDLK